MGFMPTAKPFSWSYSRLKNYENCPKQFWHTSIAKDVPEEESAALAEGQEVHDALAHRLGKKKTELPMGLAYLEPYAAKIEAGAKGGRLETEMKFALDRDFAPTAYFAKTAWLRGVMDVVVVKGRIAMVVDWKTGKVLDDPPQLAIFAQGVFSLFPEVEAVRTEFVWTKAAETTRQDFQRKDLMAFWSKMLPRVKDMEDAWNKTSYPPTPNRLCRKWCPVAICPHHGVG